MGNKKGTIWIVPTLLVLAAIVLALIYALLADTPSFSLFRERSTLRSIETTTKLWLNGHFGVFFRFRDLGNLNWLILPLLLYYLVTKRLASRHIALVFAVAMTTLVIGVTGYHNVRYMMTVVPFLFSVLLLLLWWTIENKSVAVRILILLLLCVALTFNVFYHIDDYKYLWDQRISGKNPYFPHFLVSKLNALKPPRAEARVLTVNQPLFYYYTKMKGIDVLHPAVKQSGALRKSGDRDKVFYTLKDQLNVSHVLIGWMQEGQFREKLLSEILDLDCRLVLNDRGYRFYSLRDLPLERQLASEAGIHLDMWKPRLVRGKLKRQLPRLIGKNGRFDWGFRRPGETDVLVIRKKDSGSIGEAVLQIGYTFRVGRGDWKDYRYVYMLATVKVTKQALNARNQLYIQDFDARWQRTTRHFSRADWRRYEIHKKLRPNVSKLIVGFIFRPQSISETFLIKDVQIFFVDHEL